MINFTRKGPLLNWVVSTRMLARQKTATTASHGWPRRNKIKVKLGCLAHFRYFSDFSVFVVVAVVVDVIVVVVDDVRT